MFVICSFLMCIHMFFSLSLFDWVLVCFDMPLEFLKNVKDPMVNITYDIIGFPTCMQLHRVSKLRIRSSFIQICIRRLKLSESVPKVPEPIFSKLSKVFPKFFKLLQNCCCTKINGSQLSIYGDET
jgi:hypothetical protein